MSGALRKTMNWLGFGEEVAKDDADYYEEYLEDDEMSDAQVMPIRPEVATTAPQLRRITTVHPRNYNDALIIGEAFRAGTPVIMNLTEMSDADAKRLVDFSAGLSFGLHGAIERVTNKVFLLSPAHVEIAGEDATAQHRPESSTRADG